MDNNIFRNAILLAVPDTHGGAYRGDAITSVCPFCKASHVSDGPFPDTANMADLPHADNCAYKIAKSDTVPCCGNCRYWHSSMKIVNNVSDCDFIGTTTADKVSRDISIDVTVSVSDDSGLDFHLMTGLNFSCPHFTPKK